jgi:hypothetical protein
MKLHSFAFSCLGTVVVPAMIATAAPVTAAAGVVPTSPPSPTTNAGAPTGVPSTSGSVALPPGGTITLYPRDQVIGGADPLVPFGTDPFVPYGTWAP